MDYYNERHVCLENHFVSGWITRIQYKGYKPMYAFLLIAIGKLILSPFMKMKDQTCPFIIVKLYPFILSRVSARLCYLFLLVDR